MGEASRKPRGKGARCHAQCISSEQCDGKTPATIQDESMIFDETAFSPNGKCAYLFDPFLFLPLMLTENLDVHFLTFKFPCPKVGDPTKFLLVSHLYMSHDTRFPE